MIMHRILPLLFSITCCLAGGEVYSVRCKSPSCGFRTEFDFGSRKAFCQVQGFCSGCEKFVKLTWPRKDPSKEPNTLKYVGNINPEIGRSYFQCPDCSGSFQNIPKPRVLKASICPKCKESKLVCKP